MALAATTIWEVETGGNDTSNSGAFDPGQTAGMFTDGAATSATGTTPSFTSASYNFVAGDIGAWLYIASGTNWTAGWYKITAAPANAATLSAASGAGVLKTTLVPTTAAGCATTASPTGATWAIDYSQQASPKFTYTDLASAGTGLTVSSSGHPFSKEQVGNSLVITSGTNFNTGRYVIASVAAGVATVVGPTNITTGAGASGVGSQGGALLSPALPFGIAQGNNIVAIKAGTYSITSASTNVAGGCISGSTSYLVFGYNSVRGDLGTAPLLQASGISTATLVALGSTSTVMNLSVDGASLTSIKGFSEGAGAFYKLSAANCTNGGHVASAGGGNLILCSATGCSTQAAISGHSGVMFCEAYSNTTVGFSACILCWCCISRANTGASSDAFVAATASEFINCSAYGCGRDGFRVSNNSVALLNCLAETNSGSGYNLTGADILFLNCGDFNNTSANVVTGSRLVSLGHVVATGTFFVNAASGNLALNSTASQGALARAAGLPGVYPAGLTTGFLDIGAAQHQDVSTTFCNPLGGYIG